MTSNYIFSSTNGTIIPDTSNVKTTVQNEYTQAFQDYGALSLEDATPQGRFIDLETNARISTIAYNCEVANVLINISMSSGSALDDWGSNFGIPRNGASPSTVPVTVGGVPGTIITANSEGIDANGVIWLAENEIIIGADGTASGVFKCSKTGPISLSVGQLNKIVASSSIGIDGWETITNTSNATLGSDEEADEPYKLRILESLFSGSALFGNYSSAVNQVDGVRDVFVYDNPYGTAKQLDNISIPAHSVYACVDGGADEDVAYALYSVKSAGAGWCGNTTVTVQDKTYKTNNTVTFQNPSSVNFEVEVTATNILNSNVDLTTEIQDIINNYFSNLYQNLGYAKVGIRAILDPFQIAALLQSQINGISVNSVQIGLKTPANHATAEIIKASVTSGITWASVNASTFASEVSSTNGRYSFVYDGADWKLNENTITLSDYGISVEGTPIEDDKIIILYSNGNLSSSPIQVYANEKPAIATADITVNINE